MRIEKVFIASPSYNPPEQATTNAIRSSLELAGFETVVSKTHDVYHKLAELLKANSVTNIPFEQAQTIARQLAFHNQLYYVCEGTDATVLNLEGRVPDEESVCLASIAYARKKPLVVYSGDSRTDNHRTIVAGLTDEVVRDVARIPEKLLALEGQNTSQFTRALTLSRKLTTGSNPDLAHLAELGIKYLSGE